MANFWTQNEKWIVALGILATGYAGLAKAFADIPQLPAMLSNPMFSNISVMTVAAGLSVYGAIILLNKY